MAFTIVAGISSSGKSTYIDSIGRGHRVLGNQVKGVDDIPDGCCFHYNTLTYADNRIERSHADFLEDRVLRSIVASGLRPHVVYVYCRRNELLRRIRARTTVEDGLGTYPSEAIERFVLGMNYHDFHRRWLELFNGFARTIHCVQASGGRFEPVTQKSVLAGGRGMAELYLAGWWREHGRPMLRTTPSGP